MHACLFRKVPAIVHNSALLTYSLDLHLQIACRLCRCSAAEHCGIHPVKAYDPNQIHHPEKKLSCACRWQAAPGDALLQRIAASTEGFAGADLQALCTGAVMAAVTRSCPHLVDQLCHTASTGLCPDPVSQSGWKPHQQQQQQQQQPDVQQQQQQHQQPPDVQQHQRQLENQQQEQQQPDKQQEQLQANQQDKQQEQGTCDQQQSDRQQQQDLQQQHEQPQDAGDGADRVYLGEQVMQATHQNQHQQQDRAGVLQCRGKNTQADQQKQHHVADEVSEKLRKKLLTKLRVKAADWRTALVAAPLPCSARQNLSALASGHAKALPHHLVPLLLPCISRALQCIAAAQLPWQGTTAAALEACTAAAGTSGGAAAAAADEAEAKAAAKSGIECLLVDLGAVERLSSAEAGKHEAVSLRWLLVHWPP